MSDANDLTARMFTAAKILTEFDDEHKSRLNRPHELANAMAYDLRTLADRWDREDAANAEDECAIELLARDIHLTRIVADVIHAKDWDEMSEWYQQVIRIEARQLYISGYRKAGQ
jgi:hypothetical protein